MKNTSFPRLLAVLAALFAPLATGLHAQPAPPAPNLPAELSAHWHSGKVLSRPPLLSVIDLQGSNHLDFPGWASVSPTGGILLDGTQQAGLRLAQRQPVSNRFILGVDLNPAVDGPEHQTLVYLYGYCELRYRLSRGELNLNVWQISREEPGKQIVSNIRLPVPAGKWSRIEVVIADKSARLIVDGVPSEVALSGTWEFLPESVPVFIGHGGTDRAYKGMFNHLYFAEQR